MCNPEEIFIHFGGLKTMKSLKLGSCDVNAFIIVYRPFHEVAVRMRFEPYIFCSVPSRLGCLYKNAVRAIVVASFHVRITLALRLLHVQLAYTNCQFLTVMMEIPSYFLFILLSVCRCNCPVVKAEDSCS